MKIEYDKDHDIAYVALGAAKAKDVAYTTVGNGTLPEPWHRSDVSVTFTLDWDKKGRLLGIEVSPASAVLAPEALKA